MFRIAADGLFDSVGCLRDPSLMLECLGEIEPAGRPLRRQMAGMREGFDGLCRFAHRALHAAEIHVGECERGKCLHDLFQQFDRLKLPSLLVQGNSQQPHCIRVARMYMQPLPQGRLGCQGLLLLQCGLSL